MTTRERLTLELERALYRFKAEQAGLDVGDWKPEHAGNRVPTTITEKTRCEST